MCRLNSLAMVDIQSRRKITLNSKSQRGQWEIIPLFSQGVMAFPIFNIKKSAKSHVHLYPKGYGNLKNIFWINIFWNIDSMKLKK